MKFRTLLFGSAAALAAGTGAQAADLPTVEPVEYVRICDAFGTGFYYIPGTDTCLKVGGYVRAETHWVDGDVDVFYGAPTPEVNNWTTRVRGQVNLDARTQTEFGLVRAYIALEMQVGHDNVTEGTVFVPGIGIVPGTPNYTTTEPNLAAAFIQISNDWGTFTAGHTGSFFDFFGSHGYGSRINIDDPTTEATLFAWTFMGGNGFSFTIAAEDPATDGRRKDGDDDYEGQEAPDGVANIRVDQGWGSAQVMGAVRHIHDVNGDGFGWAAGAGVSISIPGGWAIEGQGGYSEGAIGYVTTDPGTLGDFDGPDGDDTNSAWSVRAGVEGPLFNPNLTVWLDGSFTHVEENDNAVDQDEYEQWAFKAGARWSPVDGLGMGPEFAYQSLDMDDNDNVGITEEQPDFDVWGVMWRIQRDF